MGFFFACSPPLFLFFVILLFFYYSWFTMFCEFLLYNKVTQSHAHTYIHIHIHIYIYTHSFSFVIFHHVPSHHLSLNVDVLPICTSTYDLKLFLLILRWPTSANWLKSVDFFSLSYYFFPFSFFLPFSLSFFLFGHTHGIYGNSQTRVWIGSADAGFHPSHSNAGSDELSLWPTPQLEAMLDP